LLAWCELRADFRSFRLDRFAAVEVLERTFAAEEGKRLEDFLDRMRQQEAKQRPDDGRPAAPRPGKVTLRGKTPVDPEERAAWREFQTLGSIGPACALDLLQLGFRKVADLRGQDPNELYARLCEMTGQQQDPCVEDTLRCAIAQAEVPELPDK